MLSGCSGGPPFAGLPQKRFLWTPCLVCKLAELQFKGHLRVVRLPLLVLALRLLLPQLGQLLLLLLVHGLVLGLQLRVLSGCGPAAWNLPQSSLHPQPVTSCTPDGCTPRGTRSAMDTGRLLAGGLRGRRPSSEMAGDGHIITEWRHASTSDHEL